MKVTAVTAQKRKDRFNVMIDGDFWFGISGSVLARSGLYEGKEFSKELLDEIARDEIFMRVYERCVGKIARRPNSRCEIEKYIDQTFRKKSKDWFGGTSYDVEMPQIIEDITQKVIGRLEEMDLLSDEKFAEWWVNNRIEFKPRGWMMIEQELFIKGISREIIQKNKTSEEIESKLAEEVFGKTFRGKSPDREKVIRKLRSKGFGWDIISKVMEDHSIK